MADGDDGIDTESFLSGTSSIEGVGFSSASGIKVQKLAKAIVGTMVFSFAVGVNTVIGALTEAYTTLIDGVGGFLAGGTEFVNSPNAVGGFERQFDGLIDVVFGTGIAAIRGAWSFTLTEFGPFAFPVALAVLLATGYVAGRGLDRIRGVV